MNDSFITYLLSETGSDVVINTNHKLFGSQIIECAFRPSLLDGRIGFHLREQHIGIPVDRVIRSWHDGKGYHIIGDLMEMHIKRKRSQKNKN